MYTAVEEEVRKFRERQCELFFIAGDFTAHKEELDGYQDR